MAKKSKVNWIEMGVTIGTGIGSAIATNVIKDKTKDIIKNDHMRNIGVPLVIFGASVATGVLMPSLALPASAAAIGSGLHLVDGVIRATPLDDHRKAITGLAGDNDDDDAAIVVNGEAELLAYAKALNPQIPDGEIRRQIAEASGDGRIKDAVIVNGDGEEDELNGRFDDLM